jgi:hypothetical protein
MFSVTLPVPPFGWRYASDGADTISHPAIKNARTTALPTSARLQVIFDFFILYLLSRYNLVPAYGRTVFQINEQLIMNNEQ